MDRNRRHKRNKSKINNNRAGGQSGERRKKMTNAMKKVTEAITATEAWQNMVEEIEFRCTSEEEKQAARNMVIMALIVNHPKINKLAKKELGKEIYSELTK